MHRYLNRIGLIFLLLNITSCNLDYKPSYVSSNIDESKTRGVFIGEYKIDKDDLSNKIGFNYNEIWVEKRWSSYLDKYKKEKINVSDHTSQLVFNFKDDRLFSGDIYWGKFTIRDEKDNTMGSDKGLLFLDLDSLNLQPQIKLFIYKVITKYKPKMDTIKIGELSLTRQ